MSSIEEMYIEMRKTVCPRSISLALILQEFVVCVIAYKMACRIKNTVNNRYSTLSSMHRKHHDFCDNLSVLGSVVDSYKTCVGIFATTFLT